MSTIRSPFSCQFILPNFSTVLIVFHQLFTWIALGDADMHFSLILIIKVNAVEERTKLAA